MTKNLIIYFFLFFVLVIINSCNENKCLKSPGDITTLTYKVDSFNSIQLFDLFELVIKQDSSNYIQIETEENFQEGISYKIIDSSLIFENNNNCRFFRNTGNLPKITIHTPDIDSVLIFEASKVIIPDTFKTSRFLLKYISEIGYADITIQTNHLALSIWGESTAGEYYIKGKTVYFQTLLDGASFLYADSLESNYTTINNYSAGDAHISVKNTISASIYRSGNIYYKGNPFIKNLEEFSTGKLIKVK